MSTLATTNDLTDRRRAPSISERHPSLELLDRYFSAVESHARYKDIKKETDVRDLTISGFLHKFSISYFDRERPTLCDVELTNKASFKQDILRHFMGNRWHESVAKQMRNLSQATADQRSFESLFESISSLNALLEGTTSCLSRDQLQSTVWMALKEDFKRFLLGRDISVLTPFDEWKVGCLENMDKWLAHVESLEEHLGRLAPSQNISRKREQSQAEHYNSDNPSRRPRVFGNDSSNVSNPSSTRVAPSYTPSFHSSNLSPSDIVLRWQRTLADSSFFVPKWFELYSHSDQKGLLDALSVCKRCLLFKK